MGTWFSRASEIEELRVENQRLKEQVATLEARLRAAYADAGVTALALSLIHISEPTRRTPISDAVFCLKKFFFNDTATTEIYTV